MPELIDRIEAIQRIKNDFCSECDCEYGDYDFCIGILNEMPTIDAEPVRHGLWMKIEPTIKLQSRWKCSRSKCGGIVHAITDYCPYCGARMDGGADNG